MEGTRLEERKNQKKNQIGEKGSGCGRGCIRLEGSRIMLKGKKDG